MTTHGDHRIRQDVYRTQTAAGRVYLKLTVLDGLLVVSLDPDESMRVSTCMQAFNRAVNVTYVDPSFIASVRKKLALDQREAAEIFGGGANAFSRYENQTAAGADQAFEAARSSPRIAE